LSKHSLNLQRETSKESHKHKKGEPSMRVPLYSIQGLPAGKVSVMARPRGGDWLIDEIKDLQASGVEILVSLLTDAEVSEFDLAEESALCQDQGIAFLSLPVLDRDVPAFSTPTFQFLNQLGAELAEGKHIAFHCRQGLGRAVLMAACLLALSGMPPDQACAELSKVRGYAVPETEEQRAWVLAFARSQVR
jgi:protein-tyrosine phosphatase